MGWHRLFASRGRHIHRVLQANLAGDRRVHERLQRREAECGQHLLNFRFSRPDMAGHKRVARLEEFGLWHGSEILLKVGVCASRSGEGYPIMQTRLFQAPGVNPFAL